MITAFVIAMAETDNLVRLGLDLVLNIDSFEIDLFIPCIIVKKVS